MGDFIKIFQNLSIWEHFEAQNIEFLKKNSEILMNFCQIFRKKAGPIEQHKPQISENSFLKTQ